MVCIDRFLFLLTETMGWPTWQTFVEKVRFCLLPKANKIQIDWFPQKYVIGWLFCGPPRMWVISEFQSGCGRHRAHTSSVVFEIHIVSWLSGVVESSRFPDLYTVYRLNLVTRNVLCWRKFLVTCQLTSSETQAVTWWWQQLNAANLNKLSVWIYYMLFINI